MSITKISPSVVDFDASITISTADNLDTLTLTSTDADASVGPTLALYRNSSSPADSDIIGSIDFDGRNDNSQDVQYSRIISQIVDASDGTEDATLYIQTIAGGTNQDRITIKSSETVFNEDSSDLDFRVESDGNAKALVILGDKYGLGVGRDPESAYNGYTSIELGQQATLIANDAGDDVALLINAFLDSSGNWIRKETGVAGNLNLDGDQLKYFTAASGSADSTVTFAQRLRIDTDGIKFGSDTAAANALDDYEEGTYTPTMFGVTTAGSVAYSNQAGWYTKVGSIVVAYFDIAVSSASGMAGTTALTLPVQSDNINAYMGVTYWDVEDNYFDAGKGATGYVYPNTTRIELYQTTDGAKGHDVGNTFKANQTGRISGSVTYFSAT